jgi:hypothetical protein
MSTSSTSRRQFIKYGVAGVIGFGVASAIEIPILTNSIQNDNDKINKLQSDNSQLQSQLASAQQTQGFLTLNATTEIPVVEAIAETIIPTDSTGPGAKEAGVIYFIDRMLAGNYGKGGNMYLQGPFVTPQTGSLTVAGTVYSPTTSNPKTQMTYSGGTITPRLQAGTAYQYAFNPREFWRRGLVALQKYCNAAYGGKFETLSSTQKIQVLQDMFDNKSDNVNLQDAFQGPNAGEFFNELHDMVTAGFWTDPIYGGNQGMVGWQLLAFNANNWGDDIGLGATKLMVANTPTRLPPKSLTDLQKAGGGI